MLFFKKIVLCHYGVICFHASMTLFVSAKSLAREEYGDMSKYINFTATTKDGKRAKFASSLNSKKIDEDLAFAGYNMIVTSELDMPKEKVYQVYHDLRRIEECFRIMKSYLEARLHIRSFHDLPPCPDHIEALGNKGIRRQKPTWEIGGIHKAVFGYGYG